MIGMAAAYAFSRLRFKGRKSMIQTLLLLQVFPSFLALAAIFVIMSEIYKVFPFFGMGSWGGLMLVYLGGSMGVNAWLLKGFTDSIPAELEESAKIDGATPSQIYWLIFFPLVVPVLAVVALLSFIGTFNEFVMASVFLTEPESRTLAVGLQQFAETDAAPRHLVFISGANTAPGGADFRRAARARVRAPRRLLEWGVDARITDRPDVMVPLVRGRSARG